MQIAQTSMLAASLGLLIYIAVAVSASLAATQQTAQHPFVMQSEVDSAMREEMMAGTNYVHKSDTSKTSLTTLLNGITLGDGEFVLLYDSTPYASKGHIALNLPCEESHPQLPIFQVLAGRAPDLAPLKLGYVDKISNPPDTCVYHSQFGFGLPVTDLALQNASGNDISLRGPHSVVITIHESFLPTATSAKEIQHQQLYPRQP